MASELTVFLDELARRSGRGGDTRLAHVTPREEGILKAFGGRGSINPTTGLREYQLGEPGVDYPPELDHDPLPEDYWDDQAEDEPEPGVTFAPELTNTALGPTPASAIEEGPAEKPSVSSAIGEALKSAVAGSGFGPPTGQSPGAIGTVLGATVPFFGPLMAAGRFAQSMAGQGYGSLEPYRDLTEGAAQDEDEETVSGRALRPAIATDVPKPPAKARGPKPLERPGRAEVPAGLHVPSYMTPLQQRSYIATQGLEGQGPYRGPEAQAHWTNLAMRSMLGGGGELVSGARILPIELQYMREIMGMDAPAEGDTEALLRALSER